MFLPLLWSPNTAKNSLFGGITAPFASAGTKPPLINFNVVPIVPSTPAPITPIDGILKDPLKFPNTFCPIAAALSLNFWNATLSPPIISPAIL
ncbi:hypothetical protein DSECCO2_600810 [anaerobic digester metagenome]